MEFEILLGTCIFKIVLFSCFFVYLVFLDSILYLVSVTGTLDFFLCLQRVLIFFVKQAVYVAELKLQIPCLLQCGWLTSKFRSFSLGRATLAWPVSASSSGQQRRGLSCTQRPFSCPGCVLSRISHMFSSGCACPELSTLVLQARKTENLLLKLNCFGCLRFAPALRPKVI